MIDAIEERNKRIKIEKQNMPKMENQSISNNIVT